MGEIRQSAVTGRKKSDKRTNKKSPPLRAGSLPFSTVSGNLQCRAGHAANGAIPLMVTTHAIDSPLWRTSLSRRRERQFHDLFVELQRSKYRASVTKESNRYDRSRTNTLSGICIFLQVRNRSKTNLHNHVTSSHTCTICSGIGCY